MTTPEDRPESQPGTLRTFFGSLSLMVPKIRPRIEKDADGVISFDVDLDHKESGEALDQLDKELHSPRLQDFMDGVLNGNRKAWYSVVFGGVSIVVATVVAGVEFGPRHGKDIQRILDILEEHRKNKQNKQSPS